MKKVLIDKNKNFMPGAEEMDIIPKTVHRHTLVPKASAQALELQRLVAAAQNGDSNALADLCQRFEPLFKSEMRREIFYSGLGFDEGLSLARLKFIELVLGYNSADYVHFAGYVRCRIHYALYDELRRKWAVENKETPLPASDDAEGAAFSIDVIEREELNMLLKQALAKLPAKQRQTVEALYFMGYSGKEAAALLNCTPAMVTKHHKQALFNLRGKVG